MGAHFLPVITYQLFSAYASNLSTCVHELWRWRKQKHPALFKLPWMANRPTNRRERPIPEGTQQNGRRFCLHAQVEGLCKQ